MRLRLDPWAAEYNTAYYAEDILDEPLEQVEIGLEHPTWQAITPPQALACPYDALLFVDGSRRIEARVLLEDNERQLAFGALGTFALGVVDCCPQQSRSAVFMDTQAHVGIPMIHRLCTLSSGRNIDTFTIEEARTRLGQLRYQIDASEERDADAVLRQLQFAMLAAEGKLTTALSETFPNSLVICDGPYPRRGRPERVVGYVKTIHDIRIGRAELAVLRELEEGQRSPLMLIKNKDKSQWIFEWFVRLRDPRPWLYSLAGMVRMQTLAGPNPKERLPHVKALADYLTAALPHFASRQHQDPRAPQQLLPVRALENELRRQMGSAQVVRRRIMRYLASLEGIEGDEESGERED